MIMFLSDEKYQKYSPNTKTDKNIRSVPRSAKSTVVRDSFSFLKICTESNKNNLFYFSIKPFAVIMKGINLAITNLFLICYWQHKGLNFRCSYNTYFVPVIFLFDSFLTSILENFKWRKNNHTLRREYILYKITEKNPQNKEHHN